MYPTTPRTGRVAFIGAKRRSERRAMSSGGCLGFGESYTKRALDSRQQNSSVTKPIVVVGLDNGRAKRPRVGKRSTRRIIRPGCCLKGARLSRQREKSHVSPGARHGSPYWSLQKKWYRVWPHRSQTRTAEMATGMEENRHLYDQVLGRAPRSRAAISRVDVAPLRRTIEEGGFPDRAELF